MKDDAILKLESEKPVPTFIADLRREAAKRDFIIHNDDKMEMAHIFGSHGVEVAEDFDLHMVQLCKPEKAAKSLTANPERAILMPKFIMVFSSKNRTQIRFLKYGREQVRTLVDDAIFPESLAETYRTIEQMITAAARS